MELHKVESKTLRALIYDQLKEKIMSGEIKPGEDLSLRTLANKLEVSLMPVREAVWQLESDKILVVRNNRGIKVNTLTNQELQEALHLRYVLESEALSKSCENRNSDEILPSLQELIQNMERDDCDPRTFLELNKQFHFTLYTYSNSPILIDLIERLWARITPYVYLNITKNEDLKNSPVNNYHWSLYKCFESGDAEGAVSYLKKDIENPAMQIIGKAD